MSKQYVKPEYVLLKSHPEYNEKWVQDIIAEDPSVLDLGELVLIDSERQQPGGGRLDLLLKDPSTQNRYEVELQLGSVDESHIIRTIEYWEREKKRSPEYEHCAVLVAEDITSRFLNVIALFNGILPLIAIQMKAISIDDKITLVFTKVMDERIWDLGNRDDDTVVEQTDRPYWESKNGETLLLADEVLKLVKSFDNTFRLKYNKYYIGLERNGRARNFLILKPRSDFLRLSIYVSSTPEIDKLIEEAGFMDFESWENRYMFRLTEKDLSGSKLSVLTELAKRANEQY